MGVYPGTPPDPPMHGNSVNALVSPSEAAVQYQRFEDVIAVVRAAELGKFDLTDAYKHVLVHPDYWHLLGISGGSHTNKIIGQGVKLCARFRPGGA